MNVYRIAAAQPPIARGTQVHATMLSTLNATKRRIIQLEAALEKREAYADSSDGADSASTPPREPSPAREDEAGKAASSVAHTSAPNGARQAPAVATAEVDLEESIANLL